MPNGLFGGSVEQAFNNRSVFNDTQDKEKQAIADAEAEAFVRQANLYGNMPVDYTGNINLANRPVVQNPDGSVSTVRSMSFNENGKEVLIPTVSQSGTIMNPQQAIDEYHRTGQNFGVFNSPEAATAMAQKIHEQQASGYAPAQQQAPASATQAVGHGTAAAARKLTPEEYQMQVINNLMIQKGYSYEDAAALMAPYINMYAQQDAIEKRQQAEGLAAELDKLPIDDPKYRALAFQMARLDPNMAKLYLSDMVTRKDLWNRQNKRDDMAMAHQWQEYMKNTYGRGGGGGGRGGGGGGGGRRGRPAAEYGGVTNARYQFAQKFLEGINKRLANGEKISPREQQMALAAERMVNSFAGAMLGFGDEETGGGTVPAAAAQQNAGGLFSDAALRNAFNLSGGVLDGADAEKVAAVAQANGVNVSPEHVKQQWAEQNADNEARVAAEAESANQAVDPGVAARQAREEAQALGLHIDSWTGEVSPAGPYDRPTEEQLANYREWASKWRR